ncbi:MAG: tetratricopeptide repeat protein, partial [Isosphaeraceae bacterium]
GVALYAQGKPEQAVTELREALRLKPDSFEAHNGLGAILCDVRHDYDGAIVHFRAALRLRPNAAAVRHNLGAAFTMQGKVEEGIAEFRAAIRLEPDDVQAHNHLGVTLRSRGEFTEAIAELRKARDLAKTDAALARQIEQDLIATEQQALIAARLPTVLSGKRKPADAAESLGFARLCYDRKLHGASARMWTDAFQAEPKLAGDMQAGNRYNAACAAALAGSGQGKDNPPLDAPSKARWRRQAIDWLKADLAAWSKMLEKGPPAARESISETLKHWKADADLAGLRDAALLAKLNEDEQKACRALWADVDALLKKAPDGKP